MIRFGGWLFRRRTWLPVPLALALLLIPASRRPSFALETLGATLVVAGELLRLWGVRHIGVISRTRGDRLGPLVDDGPFAYVRNPLYLGNIALWVGFALCAGVIWMAPLLLVVLGVAYHAIVRWEEGLLASRMGAPYLDYMTRVPRWIPRWRAAETPPRDLSWRATFFSERGTLIAIAVAGGLIAVKLTLEF
jgi:protein-S-isoprenylcysteine O-methyltransferase Ste14